MMHDGPLVGRAGMDGRGRSPHCTSYQSTVKGRTEVDDAIHLSGEMAADSCHPVTPVLSFKQSLRLGAVWHLAFLSLYLLYIVIAFINNLILYLKDDAGLSLQLS